MTDTRPDLRQDLSVDQQLALRTAAARLAAAFEGTCGTETVEGFLHAGYDQFATASSVPNYLPPLAERFTRQRLQALARVEGHHRDGRPVAQFLGTHNAGSSQMALGLFTHLAGDHAVGWSGGSCTSPSPDNPPHPGRAGSGTAQPWERTD